MSYKSKDKRATSDSKLVAGIQKLLASSPPLPLHDKTMTIAEIISMLQARIAAGSPVVTAKAAWEAAVATERAYIQQTDAYVKSLRAYLAFVYGATPETLAEFGMAVRKRRVLKSEQLAEKASKARATREAHRKVKAEPAASPAPAPPPAPNGGK